jgi:Tfp pilus assembly protein PilX
MDPRVQVSAAGLEKKLQMEMRMASLLSETSKALAQAEALRDSLQKISQQAGSSIHDSIQTFQNKLAAILDGAPGSPPDALMLTRVNGQISVLYGQVWQVDAEPTVAQSDASAAVDRDASDILKRWAALRTSELPNLNRALRDASLSEVQIESNPHQEESGMDEE